MRDRVVVVVTVVQSRAKFTQLERTWDSKFFFRMYCTNSRTPEEQKPFSLSFFPVLYLFFSFLPAIPCVHSVEGPCWHAEHKSRSTYNKQTHTWAIPTTTTEGTNDDYEKREERSSFSLRRPSFPIVLLTKSGAATIRVRKAWPSKHKPRK